MSLFKSTKQVELCPECGSALQIKRGKQGLFLGCSSYPQCDYIKSLHQTNRVIKDLTEICPECGHFLQLKQGNFGIFIGCSHYPECHFTVHDEAEEQEEFDCPECKTHKLVARKGRSGKTFYGCSGFPNCKFTLASKPIAKTCPQCQCSIVTLKKQRGKSMYLCANKSCQYLFSEENE
ncbi:topoisomerase DNA-binding C4 zinc finger domain-containing protein [Actinobacillus pleuropneumoniae]|uniref:DNA topoisomerase family protein n=1 Tax=Actinobacillus pleuropneumoniae TaxID=715 RepID=UPI003B029B5B